MDLRHPIARTIPIVALLGLTLESTGETPASALPIANANANAASTPPPTATASPTPKESLDARPADAGTCPSGMLLVEGEHCPDIEQVCARWVPDPAPYQNIRCAEYAKPSKCKVPRVPKRFCIDRYEYTDGKTTNDAGLPLPVVRKSWLEAKAICEGRGARLCKESEWELACEGPEMSPYPYGWTRDSTACNFDRTDLGGAEDKLIDHRAPIDSFPRCVSPYGVRHMVGNVDEWAEREGASAPYRSALRGGWWLPGRNRCRAATLHHDESYGGKQVGFRCCKDAP